jgi:hypothetical protein
MIYASNGNRGGDSYVYLYGTGRLGPVGYIYRVGTYAEISDLSREASRESAGQRWGTPRIDGEIVRWYILGERVR